MCILPKDSGTRGTDLRSSPPSAPAAQERARDAPPKLAILTSVLRADFHLPLRYFHKFSIWHFYARLSSDIEQHQLGPRAVRFKNAFDLILKLLRLKPALIQGGEPYDFPQQFPIIIATLLAARILRVPYYFPTFENIPPEVKYAEVRRLGIPLSPLVIPLLRFLARKYVQGAILVFAGNKGAEENMKKLGVPENRLSRLIYATWGVELDLFCPEWGVCHRHTCHKAERIPDMGPHGVLFVGRLVKQKGVHILISAFQQVKSEIPDAQLFIIGEGELKEELLRRVASLNIASSIHILGTVPNYKLPTYFRAARVTVTPSITTRRSAEQVGMVNIQSLACGTPVVTTTSGSIPEFVRDGETGLLVPENDPSALARAIIILLRDPILHARLSRNAREYAVTHYDSRRNVRLVEETLLQYLRQYAHNI